MRILMAAMMVAAMAIPAAAQAKGDGGGDGLYNVAVTTLGATAKGSGANFNKDWPAIGTLNPGQGGGTIFNPFKGARIDIRLVIPVEIKAVEIVGLDYNGTKQVSGVDIYIEDKLVTHAELPEQPGKPFRVAVEGKGQHVSIVGTGEHPIRTMPDGKKGPDWGGFARIRIYSPTNVAEMMKSPAAYQAATIAAAIAAPSGSAAGTGEVAVTGEPRQTKGHPCTIWDAEDIAHYKEMLKTSKVLQDQYAGLQRAMDKRITQPTGVPEPRKGPDGQWVHISDLENGGTHNQLALDIANLGQMYVLSGEAKYAEYAKKLLLAYADVYDKYVPGNRPGFAHDVGKCFDQRLGDSTWLIQVAKGYDLVYNLPSITAEERAHIENDLLKAAANFIAGNRAHLTAPTNWSAIGTCSVLITGYATDDQKLIDLAMYGPGGTKESPKGGVMLHFSEKSIDADGMWTEGAMGYQFMALEALIADAEILWHHGIDMYRHRGGALKRLFDSPLAFSYPDLKTPAIHDSGYGSIVDSESFMYEYAYRRYKDPKYLLILNQAGMHLDTKFQQFTVSVLYDRDVKEKTAAVEWQSINLFGVGYGILRNTSERGTVSLLMDYGPNRSHGHPDKLNIDLWAGGERIIPDPGSVWYEQPIYKRWYHPTLSHNTLVVDELEQQACDGRQLVYGPADTMGIERAMTDGAYAGVTMDRAVFLTSDYVADMFGAFAGLPRKMDLAWHVRGKNAGSLRRREQPSDEIVQAKEFEFSEPVENGYNELANLLRFETRAGYGFNFSIEGQPAFFRAAGGTPTEVITGEGWLGLERPATIIQRRNVNQTIYGNVVGLDIGEPRKGPYPGLVKGATLEGSLDKGYGLLTVERLDSKDLCFVSYRPGRYKAGDLETDAQQAFVMRDDEVVRSMYLGGGTTLKCGPAVISRSEPGLAYIEKIDNGAYIVGNPSATAATVTVVLSPLNSMSAYDLDADGKRVGERALKQSEEGTYSLAMKAASRVEFAPKGQTSVYDHRQAMLRKRVEEQAAAMAKAANEAKTRTAERERAAAEKPVPAGTMVVVQAEAMSGEGGGKVGISETKRGAVGKAFASWDAVGHWIEWTFDVPAEGYYNLTLCYSSGLALCEREIKVNGEMQEPFAPINVPGTGGWANGSDDWQLYTAPSGVSEKPLLVKLAKGKNVIRLTNTNGRGINLDYLAVTSPDVRPTRAMLAEKLK